MDIVHWFELGVASVAIAVGISYGINRLVKGRNGSMLLKEKSKLNFPDSCFWNTHTRIHETLTELRVKTNCARVQLVQFHNTGEFLDGISMKKMSLTHESLSSGVSSEMSVKKDLLLSMCVEGLTILLKDSSQLYITDKLEDSWCKQLLQNSNVVSFSFLPIRRKNQVIGYVMCQWCSWTKTDLIVEEEITENIEEVRQLVEVQLEQERKSKSSGPKNNK